MAGAGGTAALCGLMWSHPPHCSGYRARLWLWFLAASAVCMLITRLNESVPFWWRRFEHKEALSSEADSHISPLSRSGHCTCWCPPNVTHAMWCFFFHRAVIGRLVQEVTTKWRNVMLPPTPQGRLFVLVLHQNNPPRYKRHRCLAQCFWPVCCCESVRGCFPLMAEFFYREGSGSNINIFHVRTIYLQVTMGCLSDRTGSLYCAFISRLLTKHK